MDRALADVIATWQHKAFEDVLDARQLATKQGLQLEIEKVRGETEKVRAEITRISHQQLKWFLGFGIACACLSPVWSLTSLRQVVIYNSNAAPIMHGGFFLCDRS